MLTRLHRRAILIFVYFTANLLTKKVKYLLSCKLLLSGNELCMYFHCACFSGSFLSCAHRHKRTRETESRTLTQRFTL